MARAIATFNAAWCPRLNATSDVTFRTRKAQFGDGYVQVEGDGINARLEQWNLDFVANETTAKAIMKFFDDQGGRYAFHWTNPLGILGVYRCESYKITAMGKTAGSPLDKAETKFYSVSATFIQAFAP